ncbi:MAG TPA: hydantoinase/oxoprolinase family protein [Stellaceae bacterium]|nr:hydantoinase/oxoprolinase family protein [Stellaceae bacterium]
MTSYLGTDVGGTFTDFVFYSESGEVHCWKVPSTPARPGDSVLDGVDEIRAGLALPDGEWRGLAHTHSSTVATNALIERKGAKIGLIVSAGFRDLFELQRLAIPHPMRFDSRRPAPLVPRALVCEARGRIDAEGVEIEPLAEGDVAAAAEALVGAGVEIAVVALLHSYKNPAHERCARDVAHEKGLAVELSSEVWPQAREYERAVLTAINAAIRPIVEGYIGRLEQGLARRGIASPARIQRSNGGAELAATMRERPVAALLSGPAAGVAGAAAAAQDAGWEAADLMTLDVGGTSADIGVVRAGRPVLSSEEHIADFPLLIPTIAVSSIGAGGGSILWLDPAGSLKVGPRSVGADPGPASYGSGSLVPALTDAFLVAGLLAPGQRLGGKLPLDPAPARRALESLAGPLGMSVEEVADGAIRVAAALMAAEAANVLARRGVDMPRFRMVAFGGAGPLVAAMIADEIAIDAILIPPFPGALSALGAARADLEGDLVEPVYRRLGDLPAEAFAAAAAVLEGRAAEWLARQAASLAVGDKRIELSADMRYEGQGYDVNVPLPARAAGHDGLAAAFHAAHRAAYGHSNEAAEIWLKELRAHIVGVTPKPAAGPAAATAGGAVAGSRAVRLFGREFAAQVYERAGLSRDARLAGPAIVNQMDTTSFIPEGWQAHTVASGALVLERGTR